MFPITITIHNPAQLQAVRDLGCDLAQGYLLGRPMPAPDFTARMVAEQNDTLTA